MDFSNTVIFGAAGCRHAAATIAIAACAETSSTSMDEDSAKIDLKFSLRHAFNPQVLIQCSCQVKSGMSFCSRSKKTNLRKITIDKETFNALTSGSKPSVFVWVPGKPSSRVYCHIFDPFVSNKQTISIHNNDSITPAIRYELSRKHEYGQVRNRIPRRDISIPGEDVIQAKARLDYKKIKSKTIINPLFGSIKITRHAWRHITRISKKRVTQIRLLALIPYFESILNNMPDRYALRGIEKNEYNKIIVEKRSLILYYRNIFRIEKIPHTLAIRVREEIIYPRFWRDYPLSVADIKQTATLESWWAIPCGER